MKRWDLALAVAWVLLGAGICAYALHLGLWEPSGPASGFMPFLAGATLAVGGLALVIVTRPMAAGGPFWPDRRAALRALAVLMGLAAMTLLMPLLGFLPTSIAAMIFLLRIVAPQRWTWIIATAVLSSVVFYWVFDRILDMALPRGPLGF